MAWKEAQADGVWTRMASNVSCEIVCGDCVQYIRGTDKRFHLVFLDPPFNQGKQYPGYDDDQPEDEYWEWIAGICAGLRRIVHPGGALYFMQREKNLEPMLRVVRETGWTLQSVIIWRKLTSPVPQQHRYGKSYQVIAFATNGARPRVFNRLRIDAPVPVGYKQPRENGVYVTDVWDDIRELTSGYYAGDEALRDERGARLHLQQAPVALLLRIVLSSTLPGDWVLDPFAGTGTTLVVASQLGRHSVGVELDRGYSRLAFERLMRRRGADDTERWRRYYGYTEGLDRLWPPSPTAQLSLLSLMTEESV